MTIAEAVSLVLQAFAIGGNATSWCFDMGEPFGSRTSPKNSGSPLRQIPPGIQGHWPPSGRKTVRELFYPNERVVPSTCAKIACTESVKFAWPALKRGLDELYVAMSLGERGSILARLKQIVPQFTYPGCDHAGSPENLALRPSDAGALHVVSRPVDRSVLPGRTRPANPSLGPVVAVRRTNSVLSALVGGEP